MEERDVPVAHVGRVADHGVEFLVFRVGEEVDKVVGARRAVTGSNSIPTA